jgi:hypothetical protein
VFAIDHAAAALLLKKRFEDVPIAWLLVSVQLSEMLWVVFNFAGIEHTSVEQPLRTVQDVHLESMPYSHSVLGFFAVALLAGIVAWRVLGRAVAGTAVALGVLSHLVLDLVTHAPDIQLSPFALTPKFGLGLYSLHPLIAFLVEFAFGIACWLVYRGRGWLLVAIVGFNLLNLPFFVAGITDSKPLIAGHPERLVAAIALQIVITLVVVGVLARRGERR